MPRTVTTTTTILIVTYANCYHHIPISILYMPRTITNPSINHYTCCYLCQLLLKIRPQCSLLPMPTTISRVMIIIIKQGYDHQRLKKNNGYHPQKDQIKTLDRRTQTTIFRLRTGHCGLRKHLKRLGLADSAHCECGSEEQTPEHILQTCPHLETVRQQYWPEDTEVGTKLWGQAAELQRTADFLAATGLRI